MATVEVSRPTGTIFLLATPKLLPASFIDDRRSIYWDNGIPSKDFTKTTPFVLTKRQNELVYVKTAHPDYQPDRLSPIWAPSRYALTATPTSRVVALSQPKICHPDYQPDKMMMTKIPKAALLCRPSERIRQLARHKIHSPQDMKYNEDAEWQNWELGQQDLDSIPHPSARLVSLALPKLLNNSYVPPRLCKWDVTKEARNCVATERVHKLARPKNKHPEGEDYDPHTWSVSRSALLAHPSPRIEELATPIPRKVRAKK